MRVRKCCRPAATSIRLRLGAALLALALFESFAPANATAAITFVKNVGTASSTTAGTTTTITLAAGAVTAGNSILVSITMDAAALPSACRARARPARSTR